MRRPDYARLAALERRLARAEPPDLRRGLRLVEALRQEAVALGVWPPADPLAGVEVDVRVARALNGLGPAPGGDVRGAPR